MQRIFFLTIFGLAVGLLLIGASCVSFSSNKSSTSGPAGMFVSTDRGESWKQISVLPKADGIKSISNASIYRLYEDPQDSRAMYISTPEDGMFYSFDDGKTWRQPEGVLSDGYVYAVAVHPKNKCVIYATNGRQIFRTDDCLRSWTEVHSELRSNVSVRALAFNYFPPYQLYAAETNGDVLWTFDSGYSWQVSHNFKKRLVNLVASPLKENLLYAVMKEDGLYRSEDGGASWVSLKDKLKKFSGGLEYRRFALHATKPDTVFWISTYGILRSDDRGESWTAMKLITPPGSASIYGFAVNPQNENEVYYTATIGNRSTFYKTADGGKNWTTKKVPSGQLPSVLRAHPNQQSVIYLGFSIPAKKK